ncbi:glycosyltransferase family 2 protein [Methyloligella sp. 2.7D]|uniref:glycosyltransferase family 2 protein n=1 Tax=unclassified Methyloligella TaxID=2625955 RepID=UPI00157DC651|nr:glycosyltransferase family 2 protein [Methyloligella sp. GL2]QKP77678.1 glycosyltransferase family 2 protein [Methyloligella sp. GL2]
MALRTALGLGKNAFEIGGIRAPWLLARYGKLALLHRMADAFNVTVAPRPLEPSSDAPSGGDADIIVPVYDNYDDTAALLEALRGEAPGQRSIILIDDCSPDPRIVPLLERFAAEVPNAVLLKNDSNLGFVASCNRGFEQATGDVVLLNTDIELPSGALSRLLARLRSDDDIASVTPFSNSAYGAGVPDPIRSNPRPFGASTDEIDRAFQSLAGFASIDIPRGVGFCMAISRKALDEVGTFSPVFGKGYGEEADLCRRAAAFGYRNIVAPDVYVFHKEGQSFGDLSKPRAREGLMLFLDRHPSYPPAQESYLRAGDIRAAGFMGLVALARSLGGVEDGSDSEDAPKISINKRKRHKGYRLGLRYRDEAYFCFVEDAEIAKLVLQAAGVPVQDGFLE